MSICIDFQAGFLCSFYIVIYSYRLSLFYIWLQRYALFLSGYIKFDIKYVKSKDNSADTLSQLAVDVKHKNVTMDDELAWLGTYLHCIKESSVLLIVNRLKLRHKKMLYWERYILMLCWPNSLSGEDKGTAGFLFKAERIKY